MSSSPILDDDSPNDGFTRGKPLWTERMGKIPPGMDVGKVFAVDGKLYELLCYKQEYESQEITTENILAFTQEKLREAIAAHSAATEASPVDHERVEKTRREWATAVENRDTVKKSYDAIVASKEQAQKAFYPALKAEKSVYPNPERDAKDVEKLQQQDEEHAQPGPGLLARRKRFAELPPIETDIDPDSARHPNWHKRDVFTGRGWRYLGASP
jgi:hypothetical protein